MKATTQSFLPIKDIKDDLVLLYDGSIACVIKTSAVNFGLLSGNEQISIISSFAAFLNSLSFSVQLVIRSKRLDISSYIEKLQMQLEEQKNPLLKEIMGRYKVFIESIVRENEVLDKQFYVVIPISYLELGITGDSEKHFQKAVTILLPRRDHIIRQLQRMGLKASPLTTEQLIKLFYDLFNESEQDFVPKEEVLQAQVQQQVITQESKEAAASKQKPEVSHQEQDIPSTQPQPVSNPQQPTLNVNPPVGGSTPISQSPSANLQPPTSNFQQLTSNLSHPTSNRQSPISSRPEGPAGQPRTPSRIPFIVEELPDEYGVI